MGGTNSQECLREQCPGWTPSDDCDHTLEVVQTLDVETGTTRHRIYCGKILGPLASEMSDIEILNLAIDGDKIYPVQDVTK